MIINTGSTTINLRFKQTFLLKKWYDKIMNCKIMSLPSLASLKEKVISNQISESENIKI